MGQGRQQTGTAAGGEDRGGPRLRARRSWRVRRSRGRNLKGPRRGGRGKRGEVVGMLTEGSRRARKAGDERRRPESSGIDGELRKEALERIRQHGLAWEGDRGMVSVPKYSPEAKRRRPSLAARHGGSEERRTSRDNTDRRGAQRTAPGSSPEARSGCGTEDSTQGAQEGENFRGGRRQQWRQGGWRQGI